MKNNFKAFVKEIVPVIVGILLGSTTGMKPEKTKII